MRVGCVHVQARHPPGMGAQPHRSSLPSASSVLSSVASSVASSPQRSPVHRDDDKERVKERPELDRDSTVSTVLVDDVSSQGSDRPLLADVEDQPVVTGGEGPADVATAKPGARSKPKKVGSVHFDIAPGVAPAGEAAVRKGIAEQAGGTKGVPAKAGSGESTGLVSPLGRSKSLRALFGGGKDEDKSASDKSPHRPSMLSSVGGLLGGKKETSPDEATAAPAAGPTGLPPGHASRQQSIAVMQDMMREGASGRHKTGAYYSASERRKVGSVLPGFMRGAVLCWHDPPSCVESEQAGTGHARLQVEYLWPKDSLFKYFSIMEKMQASVTQLQLLAALPHAVAAIEDTRMRPVCTCVQDGRRCGEAGGGGGGGGGGPFF
jgi:hypothetical protein